MIPPGLVPPLPRWALVTAGLGLLLPATTFLAIATAVCR